MLWTACVFSLLVVNMLWAYTSAGGAGGGAGQGTLNPQDPGNLLWAASVF
jgi:hypothetical protein